MRRRETGQRRSTHGGQDARRAKSTTPVCAVATLLGALHVLAAPVADAEPAALPPVSAPPPARAAAPEARDLLVVRAAQVAPRPDRAAPTDPALDTLLVVPDANPGARRPPTTDERLAQAVALGTNPELEPREPFRKKSRDLFRTERPVSIGDQELLMRLRLRAKAREAVSVEFRF